MVALLVRRRDLSALALALFDRLVVGHFRNDLGNLRSEFTRDEISRDFLVLDGVVQKCRYDEIGVFSMGGFSDETCG